MKTSITVLATTTGTPSRTYEHMSGGYKYRGDPDWVPGRERYREGGPARQYARQDVPVSTRARDERMRKFCALRADGVPVLEAGRRVNIVARTARRYEQQRREAIQEAQS